MPKRTKSGKMTAVGDVEEQLDKSVARKGLTGRRADAYKHGTLNNIGLKHGNKDTAKGLKPAKSKRGGHGSDMAMLKRKKMPR